jgi:hypothetical protein
VTRRLARAAAVAAPLFILACGLIDFPPSLGMSFFPDRENQVLAGSQEPSILFESPVDRGSVEAIFSVRDAAGAVSGCCRWEGQRVSFHAEPQLVPGRRYEACFSGSFQDAAGREHDAAHHLPFFYGSATEAAPWVVSTWPEHGAVVGPRSSLQVRFSEPVEPASIGRGLILRPDTARHTSWQEGGRELVIEPDDRWENHRLYSLRLGEEVTDTAGIPLCRPLQLTFLVQEDLLCPQVLSVLPAFNRPDLLFPESGATLAEGPGSRDALRIAFSEPMDQEATREAFTLSPPVPGSLCWVDALTLVFAPSSPYTVNVQYVLSFTGEAADLAGNGLAGFLPLGFAAAVEPLDVTVELVNDGALIGPGEFSTSSPRLIHLQDTGGSYDYDLVLQFSLAAFDSDAEKLSALRAVELSALFPAAGVGNPEMLSCSWSGDSRLSLTFTGLTPSSVEPGLQKTRTVYYLLLVRGGPGGVATEEGSRLPEDVEQLLVAAAE